MSTQNLDAFMIDLLQQYVQINTVHPNAEYHSAIALFAACARQDQFLVRQMVLPSGFPVLVITYQGLCPELPSVVLQHHMDVVPAGDASRWLCPPFEGRIVDGCIIGRGTQDMKGVGVVHYAALKTLKQHGVMLDRTVHLCMLPDEERGGFEGMKLFAQTELFKSLNIGFVFDEACSSGSDEFLYYKVTERKVLQIRVASVGSLEHGSQLMVDNALHVLIEFLAHIIHVHRTAQGEAHQVQPGLLSSFNITSLQSGVYNGGSLALNVIPDVAYATLDIRIAPHERIAEIMEMLQRLNSQFSRIQLEVLASSHTNDEREINGTDSEWYQHIADVLKKYTLELRPLHFEATTDLRYYQMHGIEGCGFTPFRTKNNIHGVDESVPLDDLILARNIMVDILKAVCNTEERLC